MIELNEKSKRILELFNDLELLRVQSVCNMRDDSEIDDDVEKIYIEINDLTEPKFKGFEVIDKRTGEVFDGGEYFALRHDGRIQDMADLEYTDTVEVRLK